MVTKIKQKEETIPTISEGFKCFHKSSLLFSSHHQRMIDLYPEQWVAVYNGKVVAHDSTYEKVLSVIDEKEIPRQLTIMRYITKQISSMIL